MKQLMMSRTSSIMASPIDCCKGNYGNCRRSAHIKDMKPLNISSLIGQSWTSTHNLDTRGYAWQDFADAVCDVIMCLNRGDNVLVFRHQGARRAATFVAAIVMVLTQCTGEEAYKHVWSCRAIIEDNVEEFCKGFGNAFNAWRDWFLTTSTSLCLRC